MSATARAYLSNPVGSGGVAMYHNLQPFPHRFRCGKSFLLRQFLGSRLLSFPE
jgi:hypothetical protein